MKPILPFLVPFAFALPAYAVESAQAAPVASTTPAAMNTGYGVVAGFISERLHQGMNIIGLRLHHSTIALGTIASIGSGYVELTNSDAPVILTQGTTYILEITSGAKAGVIQEITHWQGLRLTVPDDISAAGVKPGDNYSLRKAATLNSVFDPRSTGLTKGANPSIADNVLIPQGASFGEFQRCFIKLLPDGAAAWLDASTLKPVGDLPLVYPDGLIVHRKNSADAVMTFYGEVKSGLTRSVVKRGLNLVASPFPAGGFLQDLGLANDLKKSDSPLKADKVWVSAGSFGQFNTYFIAADGQWMSASNGKVLTEKIPVGSAVLIERRGPQALFSLGDAAK